MKRSTEAQSIGLGGGAMEPAAARAGRESLELAFQMSNLLGTGLDRHTLSLLIALCDRGVNPEALAALVRELSPSTAAAAANSDPRSSRPH